MIRVSELNKFYGPKNQVLRDVSFELPDRGFVCIVGPSGCGKTTLLNALGGLDTFDDGTISAGKVKHFHCGGLRSESYRNRNYGYIFQNYYLLPEHSAAYNVYLGLHAMALSHKEKIRRVREALAAVDMGRFARRLVGELSGGQQQRVAIARALARRPRVIFADEPTGNLDQTNTVNICTLLRKISRTSLVVMVTHEQSIARFFADRILSVEDGRITGDEQEWEREGLSVGGDTFYADEYTQTCHEEPGVSLRLLRQEGAAPVKITVLALKDRVVIKLDDGRNITCSKSGEVPEILEGKRPVLRLESMEEPEPEPVKNRGLAWAGKGLRLSMMTGEARRLGKEKGAKGIGTRFFLVLLTLLTLLTFADYQYVGHVDPEDFVSTYSGILEVELSRGAKLGEAVWGMQEIAGEFLEHLEDRGYEIQPVPDVNLDAECRLGMFRQFGTVKEKLEGFSYVPLEYLDEGTLLYGRLPEHAGEIVVDRWVLDKLIAEDGILQTGISDCRYFLGKQLTYSRKAYKPTIVGISDSGEPAVYMDMAGIASICVAGTEVISLSDFKALCPREAGNIRLGKEDCIVITNTAGAAYANNVGGSFSTNTDQYYKIVAAVEADIYAKIVISDDAMEDRIKSLATENFFLICRDREGLKSYLEDNAGPTLNGRLQIAVRDAYADAWEEAVGKQEQRLDARTIVTVTVVVICLVLLYLFRRAQVRERIGMAAVYRLLGIPGAKLGAIFCMESFLLFLRTTLPATAFVWGVLQILSRIEAIRVPLYLSWKAAVIGGGGILLFHMLVSLLPLWRLLRMPPAQLAAKFDY